MNKQLEKLYLPLAEENIENNPFYTAEITEKYNAFFNTYFSTDVMTLQEYNTATDKLFSYVGAVEDNAFEVGFYTAVKLLTGTGKD
ncbi:MAG: hypothetical protein K2J08_06060 [Ruminococcus sp.]|nr:hypothetical protein [Ruminococcus sp.]